MTEAERMIPEAYCEPICLAMEWFVKNYVVKEDRIRLERLRERIETRKGKAVAIEKNEIYILRQCFDEANVITNDCGLPRETIEEVWKWIRKLDEQRKRK